MIWVLAWFPFQPASADGPDQDAEFFERRVRPVLSERCQSCHGEKKQSGGLRVDTRAALLAGGDRGPAILPGQPEKSLLVTAIEHREDFRMPPKQSLSAQEIKAIKHWVAMDAPWPASPSVLGQSSLGKGETDHPAADQHWAFQPVVDPPVPTLSREAGVGDGGRPANAIDRFVSSRLQRVGLAPSPRADRRTLIRRVCYTLTGLPPTAGQVERFESDDSPHAYVRLVDRLLGSPAYGEHWARHWLDLARYSDTKGYVYAREERRWVHSWVYRDWVTESLNRNVPYDRFLLLQLAADQVPDGDRRDMAAMGFLTLGRRFLGVKRDIIDDRIDVVCRGMLGLTVSCARCHDHKYDAIPTEDYYSLYGVFDSCHEQLVALDDQAGDKAFRSELIKRQKSLADKLSSSRAESSQRARDRVADYLRAQRELSKYPANGFDQIFQKSDLLPAFVHRWEDYLFLADRRGDPVFRPWHAFAKLPPSEFSRQAETVTRNLHQQPSGSVNSIVLAEFTTTPESFDEVIERYARVFSAVAADQSSQDRTDGSVRIAGASDVAALRRVLYGPDSPCFVPDEPIVQVETFFDSATCTDLWKRQGEVDRWINQQDVGVPFALTLADRDRPVDPRVFVRGNPLRKGKAVPRRFLSAITDPTQRFSQGSGRLELARSIIDPRNPLTARVMVNRVWLHHFGQGLVATPSDFGTRAGRPSHPGLLDWLAYRFVEEAWDLKKLHRRIVLSATFQQASRVDRSVERDDARFANAVRIDPDNRLLWRMNPRRLTFEEFLDSMLSTTDGLDRRIGGRPSELFSRPFSLRRTIYSVVDRQYLPSTLRAFDFANPDLHTPKRGETIVPQQALFLMNHPLLLDRVSTLATRSDRSDSPSQQVADMFRRTLQRRPSAGELSDALRLIASGEAIRPSPPPSTAVDWQYGYGAYQEAEQSVVGFLPLPHFNGSAWQGGEKWPDATLGWVQLTADGGHPGNSRKHAAIRRWTAPREMRIQIRSRLAHDRKPGDGIRAFVVSSKSGLLGSAKAHQSETDMDFDSIRVVEGETIDFVVDIDEVLNSDEYLWHKTIREITPAATSPSVWDSRTDFPRQTSRLISPWEQLAQILYCTNEFSFID